MNRYLLRSPSVAARKLGGEMMIMSAVDSSLFCLNEVATAIWESADGMTPLDQIVDSRICPEFDVDRAAAYQDACAVVEQLSGHGILLVSPEPFPSSESAL